MLKSRISRGTKQTQKRSFGNKERKNKKKLLLWVKLRFTGENTHVFATKIPRTFLI